MPRLSVSMIVKNEEANLKDCLESVKDVADQIVIVDTGSTDRTIDIARNYGAEVFSFNWINDFSAARNFALSKSKGNWILYIDADERLTGDSKPIIHGIINSEKKEAYLCKVICPERNGHQVSIMKYPRLFKNNQDIKFKGKVHEQIENSLYENGYVIKDSEISIIHEGYDVDVEKIKSKAERNLEILLEEYKENKKGYTAFQIGQSLATLNRFNDSEIYFREAANDTNLETNHRTHAFRFLAAINLSQQKIGEAEKAFIKGAELNDKIPLLNLVGSKIYLEKKDYKTASKLAEKALIYSDKVYGAFDISINKAHILASIINASVYDADRSLFMKYVDAKELKSLNKELQNTLIVLKEMFHGNLVSAHEIKNSTVLEFPLEVLFKIIFGFYSDKLESQLVELEKQFNGVADYYLILANVALKNGLQQIALDALEKALNIDNENKQLILTLVNYYSHFQLFNKLKVLIDAKLELFKNDERIFSQLEEIRKKLNAL